MAEPVSPDVRHECRVLTRYLVGEEPSEYVIEQYVRGLAGRTFEEGLRSGPADRVLGAVARTGSFGLALADVYARFFASAGEFRRRLVLLTAILESSAGTYSAFEPPPAGRARAWAAITGAGLLFAARLGAAFVLIGPLHVAARLAGRETNASVEPSP